MNNSSLNIHLSLSHHCNATGLKYQLLKIELTGPDRIIYPEDLAGIELPSGIDTTIGVVISGRAPIWLYSYLTHELHPTAWVGCYEPRLQAAVVVATHSRLARVGQVISLQHQPSHQLSPALMIVGPPDSGKSVLSYALLQALLVDFPEVYLQRANWDGEGNYIMEMDLELTEAFKAVNKGRLTNQFFPDCARAILHLRRQKSLVIVDVGGMVQPEKQLVLEACSHYLIISAQPEEIAPWHEFCRERGNLKPLATIHSTLETCEIIHQKEPYLEMTCGPWICGEKAPLPTVLIDRVRQLFNT